MPLDAKILGTSSSTGALLEANTHKHVGGDAGLVVHTIPHVRFNPEVHPFLNDTVGTAMNQDVSFSGTPEIIHNGGTSVEWDAAGPGTWNFASGAKVVVTSANDGDTATFSEETPTTIDLSGFTALTGKVDLDTYNVANNDMLIQFDLAGVQVGNTLNLNDFIDTGDFAEQSFAIPLATFGLAAESIDGFTIIMGRSGGTKPTVKFDDIQLEQTGTPLIFKATTPRGTRFHVTEIRIGLADALTGIITVAGATENSSMIGLAYNQILGVAALTNGITFSRIAGGETEFSVTLRQLSDFLSTGSNFSSPPISDGTNTFVALIVVFPEPIVIDGNAGDFLSFTINDNLSGLLQFTAVARGAVEI